MLMQFTVENFRSFYAPQTLSLLKTKSSENLENTIELEETKKYSLLKSAAVYGANASGKSNLFRALETMQMIIINSFAFNGQLPIVPFKLSSESLKKPTKFDIDLFIDGIRYNYGFCATDTMVLEEWLFAFPKERPQKWYYREWDKEKAQYSWKFSSYLQGNKQVWKEATRENILFLSTAVQLNSEQLKPLFDWFKTKLVFSSSLISHRFTQEQCHSENKNDIIKLLQVADFNIYDVEVTKEEVEVSMFPPFIAKNVNAESSQGKLVKMNTTMIHKDIEGKAVNFDLNDESDGTRKFFAYAAPILDVLEKGRTFFIDEINCNLHPKLVEFLVKMFHNPTANPNNAQLVFTTHETSILRQDIFRRDQIWFCERDKDEQQTNLYSLCEFSPKKGTENIELGYLSGRYGGLPYIGSFVLDEEA